MLAYPLACTSTHVGLSMGTLDKFFRCPLRLKKCDTLQPNIHIVISFSKIKHAI